MRAWSETGDSLTHAHSLFVVHRRKTQWSLETSDTVTHPCAVIAGSLNQLDSSCNLFLTFFWAVQFCCEAAFAPTGPLKSADWEGNGTQFPIQWKCGTAINETNSLYLIFKLNQDCQCVTDAKACNSQNSFAVQKCTEVQMTPLLQAQQNNFTSNLSFQ